MTMQRPDTIIINKTEFILHAIPLDQYWELGNRKPSMYSGDSSMRTRGYYATWLIEDQKLYLTNFYGEHFILNRTYTLNALFPSNDGKVFAEWYSGGLTIPYGEEVGEFNVNYIQYSHETTIVVKNGVVAGGMIGDLVCEPPKY